MHFQAGKNAWLLLINPFQISENVCMLSENGFPCVEHGASQIPSLYLSLSISIYIYRYVHMYRYMYICMCMYVYIYMYMYAHPPPVDRPCPCDSVLLAGDSAEILYLNTPHTTIICKVKPLQ